MGALWREERLRLRRTCTDLGRHLLGRVASTPESKHSEEQGSNRAWRATIALRKLSRCRVLYRTNHSTTLQI